MGENTDKLNAAVEKAVASKSTGAANPTASLLKAMPWPQIVAQSPVFGVMVFALFQFGLPYLENQKELRYEMERGNATEAKKVEQQEKMLELQRKGIANQEAIIDNQKRSLENDGEMQRGQRELLKEIARLAGSRD